MSSNTVVYTFQHTSFHVRAQKKKSVILQIIYPRTMSLTTKYSYDCFNSDQKYVTSIIFARMVCSVSRHKVGPGRKKLPVKVDVQSIRKSAHGEMKAPGSNNKKLTGIGPLSCAMYRSSSENSTSCVASEIHRSSSPQRPQ